HGAGKCGADTLFSLGLCLGVFRLRLAVGADGGNMNQLWDAQARGAFRDISGARGMNVFETLTASEQNAGKIDGRVGASKRRFDLFRIANIAFDEADLTHLTQRAQEKAPV